MKIENGVDSIEVDIPQSDEKSWFITNSQSISVPKDVFMLDAFKRDFPQFDIKDFKTFTSILSRSVALQDWYSIQSGNFIRTIELPSFLSEVLTPMKYNSIKGSLSSYNKVLSTEGKAIKELSDKYDSDIKKIKENTSKSILSIISDPVVRVLIMNSSEMPISLQIKIEDYTPKTEDITQSRDRYAQELLHNYQRSLIKLISEKPDVNIDSVINGLKVK